MNTQVNTKKILILNMFDGCYDEQEIELTPQEETNKDSKEK